MECKGIILPKLPLSLLIKVVTMTLKAISRVDKVAITKAITAVETVEEVQGEAVDLAEVEIEEEQGEEVAQKGQVILVVDETLREIQFALTAESQDILAENVENRGQGVEEKTRLSLLQERQLNSCRRGG